MEVPDTSTPEELALLCGVANIKALALRRAPGAPGTSDDYREGLLNVLLEMKDLESLWWDRTPTASELRAMQKLLKLRSLECSVGASWTEEALHELAKLKSLRLFAGPFEYIDIRPLMSLTGLTRLDIRKAHVPKNLLVRVLLEFPRLQELHWHVQYIADLDDEEDERKKEETSSNKVQFTGIKRGTAGSLISLECQPLDAQARDALQSTSFPKLKHCVAKDMPFDDEKEEEAGSEWDHSMAWVPLFCEAAPGLTHLTLVPRPGHHDDRTANVGAGIARLTRLESLTLICRDRDPAAAPSDDEDEESRPYAHVGAHILARLTRLTKLWGEGVVDPSCFKAEVEALSNLKALVEVVLIENRYELEDSEEQHTRSDGERAIFRTDLARLVKALPLLRTFGVMGGWLDLGRPGWDFSRVTPLGAIVLECRPWVRGEDYQSGSRGKRRRRTHIPKHFDDTRDDLQKVKDALDDLVEFSPQPHDFWTGSAANRWQIFDVLRPLWITS